MKKGCGGHISMNSEPIEPVIATAPLLGERLAIEDQGPDNLDPGRHE